MTRKSTGAIATVEDLELELVGIPASRRRELDGVYLARSREVYPRARGRGRQLPAFHSHGFATPMYRSFILLPSRHTR